AGSQQMGTPVAFEKPSSGSRQTETAASSTPRSVVAMAPNRERTKKIVVGTDGSATATEAVRRAVELAVAERASLHIVTAYRPRISREAKLDADTAPDASRWRSSPGEVAER